MTSGIYQIRNRINNKKYIGSAVNIKKRGYLHLHRLRYGIHHNPHLQNAWNKHGEKNFEFCPLFYCEIDDLIYFEQCVLDILQPQYNIRRIARSNLGIKYSEEAKHKMSNINNSKLKPEYIHLIRGLYEKGIKQTYLAKICGVNQTTISNVITGKHWSWI